MVLNTEEWTPFKDEQDKIEHYRHWGLISPKGIRPPPIMVVDGYFGCPELCNVVGYQGDNWAAIELDDGIHVLHGEYLAEMQPRASQKLPYATFFSEVLADYVVLDIETTGFDRQNDEIIEIAAVRYSYGKEVDSFHTMVKPNCIIPFDISALTGIQEQDVADAPSIEEAAPKFLTYIGQSALVGHNAVSFDVPFLCAQLGVFLPNTVIDTLPIAREAYPLLTCHKLEYLKTALELNDAPSHRAIDDVRTTNALLWACLAPRRYEHKMWRAYLKQKRTQPKPRSFQPKTRNAPAKAAPKHKHIDIKSIVATQEADPAGALFGKWIVFTGELSMPREEAMQEAVNAGAVLKTSVSRKVSYLVVGQQDKALTDGLGISSKEKKAMELNQSGLARIEILDEKAFRDLLQQKEVTV